MGTKGPPGPRPQPKPRRVDRKIICPYCEKRAKLTTGKEVYPHRADLHPLKFWICRPCDAFVGCHKNRKGEVGGTVPLGNLATKEIRKMRMIAHSHFDALWKDGSTSRGAAYELLAHHLGIDTPECHIGQFNIEQCEKTIEFAIVFDF